MGIPTFFPWLEARYPQCVQSPETLPTIDNLYVDMNDLFYSCSEGLNSMKYLIPYLRPPSDFKYLWKDIARYLEKLVSILRPKKLLYLSFDGVPPLSKMRTRRQRGFSNEKHFQKYIAEQHEIGRETLETYFTASYTNPGCEFALRLHKKLKKYVKDMMKKDPNWGKLQIVYSGCDVPGEGNTKYKGRDADWIILGLITHLPYVIIVRTFREPSHYYLPRKDFEFQVKFKVLYVNILREYFTEELNGLRGVEIERYIDDFAVFSMLLGNDFLPRLPTLEIRNNIIDDFIVIYKNIWREVGYISNQGSIIWESFAVLLEKLSVVEESHVINFITETKNKNRSEYKYSLPIEEGATIDENLERVRSYYYETHVNISRYGSNVETMCENFLEGILWMSSYYYENECDMNWKYSFDFAPFISDVCMYLKRNGCVSLEPSNLPIISPLTSLVCSLPKSMDYLIPNEYKAIRTEFDMYFSCDSDLKYDLFSSVEDHTTENLIIPQIDVNQIVECLTKIEETEDTRKKNRQNLEKLYVLERKRLIKNPLLIDISQNLTRTMPDYKRRTRFPSLDSLNFTCSIESFSSSEDRICCSQMTIHINPCTHTLQEIKEKLSFKPLILKYPNIIIKEILDISDDPVRTFGSFNKLVDYQKEFKDRGINIDKLSDIYLLCKTPDSSIYPIPIELLPIYEKEISYKSPLYSGKQCIVLSSSLIGCLGEISEVFEDEIMIKIKRNPGCLNIREFKESLRAEKFYGMKSAALKLRLTNRVLGLIIGSFKIVVDEISYQLGLNLRYIQIEKSVLKFARFNRGDWELSDRAISICERYVHEFYEFFEKLKFTTNHYPKKKLDFNNFFEPNFKFPRQLVKDMALWVHKQHASSLPWSSCYSKFISYSDIKQLPHFLGPTQFFKNSFIPLPKEDVFVEGKIWTPPQTKDYNSRLELCNRVVNLCSSNIPFVPFGASATVIALRNADLVDVLFDEFEHITCPSKIMTMPIKHLLKIQ